MPGWSHLFQKSTVHVYEAGYGVTLTLTGNMIKTLLIIINSIVVTKLSFIGEHIKNINHICNSKTTVV